MEGRLIEIRNWEDLNADCLINIFGRVGLESLMFDIPFVCKSWYKVSLDSHCWKILDFQFMSLNRSSWAITVLKEKSLSRFQDDVTNVTPSPKFMKFAVNRSAGLATDLVFHTSNLQDNILEYILERCPALKTLILPGREDFGYLARVHNVVRENDECLLKMIRKLPNLESLMTLITVNGNLELILNQIHNHCPNFVSLGFQDIVDDDIASTLVTLFPNIKHLVLRGSPVDEDSLVLILSGCRKLELLDVRYCRGFDDEDADLLKLASRLKTFKTEGSVPLQIYLPDSDDERS